jgi:hypothetical protein
MSAKFEEELRTISALFFLSQSLRRRSAFKGLYEEYSFAI